MVIISLKSEEYFTIIKPKILSDINLNDYRFNLLLAITIKIN